MNPKANIHVGNILIHLPDGTIDFIDGKLTNGRVIRGTTKPVFASIVFEVATKIDGDGSLVLHLPRWLIDARKKNDDDDFIVFVDGKQVEAQETARSEELRIIEIKVPAGSNTVELIGTRSARKKPTEEPEVELDKELIGPLSQFMITVIDSLAKRDASDRESVVVFVKTDDGKQELELRLYEKDRNSGLFTGMLRLTPNLRLFPGDLEVKPGTLIMISYEGQQYDKTGNLRNVTVTRVSEIRTFNPEFLFDKDHYSIGDHVSIKISDPDRDIHSTIRDTIEVRISSTSDKKGLILKLVETGLSTGVFEGTFRLLSTTNPSLNSLKVADGDQLIVHYSDPYPADYQDTTLGREFIFSTNVGIQKPTPWEVILSTPRIVDARGLELNHLSQGQLIMVESQIENVKHREMKFVLLLEVRDSEDHTVHISWTEGSITASGFTNVGLSWTPQSTGRFAIRTVVLTSISNPVALSPVQIIDVNVQ
jgi:hypothetical protein